MPEIGIRFQTVGLGGLDQRVQIGAGQHALEGGTEHPDTKDPLINSR